MSLMTIMVYGQSFPIHGVTIKTDCNLESVLQTTDGQNKVSVYQCMTNSGVINIYRLNIIKFSQPITDFETYISSLKKENA